MAPYPVKHTGLEWTRHEVFGLTAERGTEALLEWKTTEALFQALRFHPHTMARGLIREQKSPMAAKMKAKSHKDGMTIKPRSPEDVDNMHLVLSLKLEQHPELKEMLAKTGEANIIEDVTARQSSEGALFWGMARDGEIWNGTNTLGNLWMELRAKL
jgi:predicted NAD-dependent protein-ADP-ribosyltransferase YbiA (DUF1768 family)